ncbi:MAG: serine/threonine protein kinase [Actinobacteria bacterium]|nr:serine/threonine protein kinase [Actinomycetota bacterium]
MATTTDILPSRYRGPELIGRGGMGEIYRAEDESLGRTVAVKVLADRFSADEAVRGRFTREALAAARLSSDPNTITIFDVGEHRGRPFIVMEYLKGGSLEDLLRKHGAQDPGRVLTWLDEAGAAIDAAHEHGVVHRDVKPGNLLLAADGSVRVADFGVATAAGLDSLTMTGTVLGTAGYLAPEQARGEPTTPATDLYALAVVAFELLTGRRPFQADNPTAEAAAHVHADVPAVSERSDLPPQLDPVFRRAMAKDPTERYPSSGDFVSALREALRTAGATTRQFEPVVAAAPVPAGKRFPIPALIGGGLLVAALAGVGVAAALTRGEDGRTAAQTVTTERVTTVQGEPTTETIVTTAPATTRPAPTPQPPPPPPTGGAGGRALTDQATSLMKEGRYEEALPIARQALQRLQGTGQTYEGYANYNVGRSLAELGQCEEALPYLDRREQLLGPDPRVTAARRLCGR